MCRRTFFFLPALQRPFFFSPYFFFSFFSFIKHKVIFFLLENKTFKWEIPVVAVVQAVLEVSQSTYNIDNLFSFKTIREK